MTLVLISELVALAAIGQAWYASHRAAIREGEALALKDKAVAVFDSLTAMQCIPQHAGDRIVNYGPARH